MISCTLDPQLSTVLPATHHRQPKSAVHDVGQYFVVAFMLVMIPRPAHRSADLACHLRVFLTPLVAKFSGLVIPTFKVSIPRLP